MATIDHNGALVRSHRLTLGAPLAVGLLDQQADDDGDDGDDPEHETRRQGDRGALARREGHLTGRVWAAGETAGGVRQRLARMGGGDVAGGGGGLDVPGRRLSSDMAIQPSQLVPEGWVTPR